MTLISKQPNIIDALSVFYGTRYKTKHFFTYLSVESCISLLKTNKWFYAYKKLLYNLCTVQLSCLRGIIRKKDNFTTYCAILKSMQNNKSFSNKIKEYIIRISYNIFMAKDKI